LEKITANLERSRNELAAHLKAVTISDDDMGQLEASALKIAKDGTNCPFEDKQKSFELLDMRGGLAITNNERVL